MVLRLSFINGGYECVSSFVCCYVLLCVFCCCFFFIPLSNKPGSLLIVWALLDGLDDLGRFFELRFVTFNFNGFRFLFIERFVVWIMRLLRSEI